MAESAAPGTPRLRPRACRRDGFEAPHAGSWCGAPRRGRVRHGPCRRHRHHHVIEEGLFFALGFCSAALLAFACLPAVWRRALRLTTRRLERLVPLSGEEVAADRDALRAGFAVEQRRIEQRLERSERARAEALIESGRRESRIAERDAEIARGKVAVAANEAALGQLSRDLAAARAECGAAAVALYDATSLAEQRADELRGSQDAERALRATVDGARATIAALETRVLGFEARVADLGTARDRAKADADRAAEALRDSERAHETLRGAHETITRERDALRPRIAGYEAEPAAPNPEEAGVAPEKDGADPAAGTVISGAAAGEAADRRSAMLEDLRAENLALTTALVEARHERDRASRLSAPPDAGGADGDPQLARLRQAIAQVADDVLKRFGSPADREGPK